MHVVPSMHSYCNGLCVCGGVVWAAAVAAATADFERNESNTGSTLLSRPQNLPFVGVADVADVVDIIFSFRSIVCSSTRERSVLRLCLELKKVAGMGGRVVCVCNMHTVLSV